MTIDPEHDDLDLVLALVGAEKDGVRGQIVVGPFTAFVAVSALQLAWRHPGMDGKTADIVRSLGEQLTALLEPGVQAVLAKGWDQAHDVPAE